MISRALSYPWIFVTELLGWVVLIASFVVVVSFIAATPIADLQLGGKTLPEHWEAAFLDHGSYVRAYLASTHPFHFISGACVLILSFLALWAIKNEQARQVQAEGELRARAQKIANRVLVVVVLLLAVVASNVLIDRAIPA